MYDDACDWYLTCSAMQVFAAKNTPCTDGFDCTTGQDMCDGGGVCVGVEDDGFCSLEGKLQPPGDLAECRVRACKPSDATKSDGGCKVVRTLWHAALACCGFLTTPCSATSELY